MRNKVLRALAARVYLIASERRYYMTRWCLSRQRGLIEHTFAVGHCVRRLRSGQLFSASACLSKGIVGRSFGCAENR